MKNHILTCFLVFTLGFNLFGQNDSVHVNLKADYCNFTWDFEGYESFDSTFLINNNSMHDTLQLYSEDSVLLDDFWLDEYKVWCRLKNLDLNEVNVSSISKAHYFIYSENIYPYDEWLLLYDFAELDTLNKGDKFNNSGITWYLESIDTVNILGDNRKLYKISQSGAFDDYVLENFGSIMNPLAPLFNEGFFGICNCGVYFEFFNGTDTTSFYYNPKVITDQDILFHLAQIPKHKV